MIGSLLMLLLVQAREPGPQVILGVDRDRVAPGDVISFTIRVISPLPDPIRVDLPSLGGFELESRSERSEVAAGSRGGRTTLIQLELRAATPGDWRLGPVSVRQGNLTAEGDAVPVTISGNAPPVTAALSRRLARIIQRAPPPDALKRAGISVVVSDEEVPVGEQVDVVTIAWFDRELRQQLRRAPTVEAPHLEGVWSYPQPAPGGIAATRQVGGRTYDLFVLHQVVFPLTAGRVAVSPARLQYSVPLAYQFFSQEEAFKQESRPGSFLARALPTEGREPGFSGAGGRGLTLSLTMTPQAGRQGEAFTAELRVRGEGNIALWPQPEVRWPPAFRVYPEAADERLATNDGALAGEKRFRFLLVADSAGALAIPPVRYTYFDLGDRKYRTIEAPAATVIVAPRGESVASRAEPPPIRLGGRQTLARGIRNSLPAPLWLGVALLPAILLAAQRVPRRRRPMPPPVGSGDPLSLAARHLTLVLGNGRLSPDDAAAIEALLSRIETARFAPDATLRAVTLQREAGALAARHGAAGGGEAARWRIRTGLLAVLVLLPAWPLRSQTPPEELYNAGAFRAAAEGFRDRAARSPEVPDAWFNLGDAAYRAGADAAALVAWIRAARLSPRDGGIRRALMLVAASENGSRASLWVAPVTPDEIWLIGLITWLTGWSGILWMRALRGRWIVLLVGGALLFASAESLRWWYQRPIGVTSGNAQLRRSPHELAPAVGEVSRLRAVRLGPARAGWIQVDAGAGQRGWMRLDGIEPVAYWPPR